MAFRTPFLRATAGGSTATGFGLGFVGFGATALFRATGFGTGFFLMTLCATFDTAAVRETALLGRAAFLIAFFFAIGPGLSKSDCRRLFMVNRAGRERISILAADSFLPDQPGMFLKKRLKHLLFDRSQQTL